MRRIVNRPVPNTSTGRLSSYAGARHASGHQSLLGREVAGMYQRCCRRLILHTLITFARLPEVQFPISVILRWQVDDRRPRLLGMSICGRVANPNLFFDALAVPGPFFLALGFVRQRQNPPTTPEVSIENLQVHPVFFSRPWRRCVKIQHWSLKHTPELFLFHNGILSVIATLVADPVDDHLLNM